MRTRPIVFFKGETVSAKNVAEILGSDFEGDVIIIGTLIDQEFSSCEGPQEICTNGGTIFIEGSISSADELTLDGDVYITESIDCDDTLRVEGSLYINSNNFGEIYCDKLFVSGDMVSDCDIISATSITVGGDLNCSDDSIDEDMDVSVYGTITVL